jgi:hypothetical protein
VIHRPLSLSPVSLNNSLSIRKESSDAINSADILTIGATRAAGAMKPRDRS